MIVSISPFRNPDGVFQKESTHDWESLQASRLQAGNKGTVFVRSKKESYTTAYFEAFGDLFGFFRGEGEDLVAAEKDCWDKVQKYLSCKDHDWEPRGYTNGLGFCKKCNGHASGVFTAEDLGLHCSVCQKPTFDERKNGEPRCIECSPIYDAQLHQRYIELKDASGYFTEEEDDEYFEILRKIISMRDAE